MSIQWRPEVNPLTTPQSYRIRFVPRNTAYEQDLAADIALRHPNFSEEDIATILNAADEAILERLLNGEQVTKRGSFSYYISFTGRLDNPDDPLPPLAECLQVNVRVSTAFMERLRQRGQAVRLEAAEKLPILTAAEDSVLGLRDVLRPDGMLRITGSNLFFDKKDSASQCLIEGTRSGSAVQTRIGSISNTEVVLMPDVPAQTDPWNNEYRLSLTTRYTENGTLRTGICKRLLRTPLAVRLGEDPGILSGPGAAPLVTVTGGSLAVAAVRARIQAVRDVQDGDLRLSLLDMEEGGQAGEAVRVNASSAYTLSGWAGSEVTSLEVLVQDYDALFTLVKNGYGGRLVDILDLSLGV